MPVTTIRDRGTDRKGPCAIKVGVRFAVSDSWPAGQAAPVRCWKRCRGQVGCPCVGPHPDRHDPRDPSRVGRVRRSNRASFVGRTGREPDAGPDAGPAARRGAAVEGPARRPPRGLADHDRRRGRPPGRARPGPGGRAGGLAWGPSLDPDRPRPGDPVRGHLHRGHRHVRGGDRRPARGAGHAHPALRHPAGSGGGPGRRARPGAQGAGRGGGRPADGGRGGRARPGRLPPRGVGVAADHAGLGRLPGPRRPVAGAGLPGRARQRRQRAGRGRAARRRRPQRAGLPLRQDRHRHRLRHRRSTASSTAA